MHNYRTGLYNVLGDYRCRRDHRRHCQCHRRVITIIISVIIPLSYCFPSQTQLVQHGIESQQWRTWQLDWHAQQVAFIIYTRFCS